MLEKTTETSEGAASDELSGDWIRDKLKNAPASVPQPSPKLEGPKLEGSKLESPSLESPTAKAEEEDADSVTELASALLHATSKPLQALERDWSAQIQTLRSGINERFGGVEEVVSKVERFEKDVERVRETLRSTDNRVERTENQTKEFLEQVGSLKTTVDTQIEELTASMGQLRTDMAAQHEILQDLRQAEERRAQGVKRLAEAFGGVQDAIGLLAAAQHSAANEPQSD